MIRWFDYIAIYSLQCIEWHNPSNLWAESLGFYSLWGW